MDATELLEEKDGLTFVGSVKNGGTHRIREVMKMRIIIDLNEDDLIMMTDEDIQQYRDIAFNNFPCTEDEIIIVKPVIGGG